MAGLIGAAANAGYLVVGAVGLVLNTTLESLALWAADIGMRKIGSTSWWPVAAGGCS